MTRRGGGGAGAVREGSRNRVRQYNLSRPLLQKGRKRGDDPEFLEKKIVQPLKWRENFGKMCLVQVVLVRFAVSCGRTERGGDAMASADDE